MSESTAPTGAPTSRGRDGLRQVVLTCSLLAVAGSAIGPGAFGGTPSADASGGALAADSTYVAPASGAFSIWSVIHAGLIALAIWQVLPAQRRDGRQRRVGWQVAASMLLNAAWVLTIQADGLGWSVPIILVLLLALVIAFVRLVHTSPRSRVEVVVVDEPWACTSAGSVSQR
ncbi:MAG TPA: tryptophan-rich sensory protein [Jiangellaceae bacterium]|nr:tryptophan-rich sensory protein [Jiangellaceae bacterium]